MHRRPHFTISALLLGVALIAAACTAAPAEPTQLAMVPELPTVTPTPVATTAPFDVPTATPTAVPSATPLPTALPEPSQTPVPPTATPQPTAIPQPTAVPEPTPEPTAIPEPTAVPEPTPEPTAIPEPTAVPEPTPEPTAVVEATVEPAGEGGPPAEHVVTTVGYVVLGQAGLAQVWIPSARVELIGFHEASHPGAQAINAAGTGLQMTVLASRGRGTPARSAADIVVPPGEPLRAPVTGTVIAARTYVLYCEHQDKLVYIEPDGLPGWQVRMFHVQGDIPAVGARVVAGETIVASGGANPLPFESQIDKFTAEPSWAHVHVEVVDTNVPDDRPPGGGC